MTQANWENQYRTQINKIQAENKRAYDMLKETTEEQVNILVLILNIDAVI